MSIHPNKIKIKEYITPTIKKKMNSWEQSFITGLFKQKSNWSNRQQELFDSIVEKYKLVKKPVKVVNKVVPEEKYVEQPYMKVKNSNTVDKSSDAYKLYLKP